MKNQCSKCGRKKIVGICEGCGEYATYSKCECEPLINNETLQKIDDIKK